MHRGSSKGTRRTGRLPESLPLSASAPARVAVSIEIARAGRSEHRRLLVEVGSTIRTILRKLGQAAEGSAVLVGDEPVPLDLPVEGPLSIVVVPTYSGG